MADGSDFPSLLPCVVANLLIFEGKRWVISDKNSGREQKQYSCLKLLVLSYHLKKQENLITQHKASCKKLLSLISRPLSTFCCYQLKHISVPSLYVTKGWLVAFESSWRGKFMFGNWTMAMLTQHTHPYSRSTLKDDCEHFWDAPVRELKEKCKTCNEMSKFYEPAN